MILGERIMPQRNAVKFHEIESRMTLQLVKVEGGFMMELSCLSSM